MNNGFLWIFWGNVAGNQIRVWKQVCKPLYFAAPQWLKPVCLRRRRRRWRRCRGWSGGRPPGRARWLQSPSFLLFSRSSNINLRLSWQIIESDSLESKFRRCKVNYLPKIHSNWSLNSGQKKISIGMKIISEKNLVDLNYYSYLKIL